MSSAYPIPDVALDGRLGIVGLTGSGKTNVAKCGVERLLDLKRRVCVIDLLDAWWGLRVRPDLKTPAYPIVIFGGKHADLPINEHSGALVGQAVAESTESTVVSLDVFDSDEARRRFARAFFDALHRHNRAPLHLVIDEADFYAPQNPLKEAVHLLSRVKELASRGRMRGFRAWCVTQRPAKLHKDVLSQCDTLVAMQLTANQDRDAIDAWIGDQADRKTGREILAMLPRLQRGQGVLWSPRLDILRPEHFPLSTTYDSGRTPEHGEILPNVMLAPLNIGSLRERLSAVEKEAAENDPRRLKAEVARLTSELATKPKEVPSVDPKAIETARKAAWDEAWKIGWDEGVRHGASPLATLLARLDVITKQSADLAVEVRGFKERAVPLALVARSPVARQAERRAPIRATPVPRPPARANGHADVAPLPRGERACLICIAQHGSVTREHLTVATGYKRSSRDAYIQRLRERGLVEQEGDRIMATDSGVAALGSAYEPLPTGAALQAYHLERLPAGERRILEVLIGAYPGAVARDHLDEATGYKRSSRDAYLQRLSARQLVASIGRGEVRAVDELFQ